MPAPTKPLSSPHPSSGGPSAFRKCPAALAKAASLTWAPITAAQLSVLAEIGVQANPRQTSYSKKEAEAVVAPVVALMSAPGELRCTCGDGGDSGGDRPYDRPGTHPHAATTAGTDHI